VRDTLYFIWTTGSQSGSSAARTAGYFAWRHAPDFTLALMRDMAGRASWSRPFELRRLMQFLIDLLVTIYVNHCDRPDVAEHTADIVHLLAVERLHMDRLGWLTELPAAQGLARRILVAVLAEPVRDWLMLVQDAQKTDFFEGSAAKRAILIEAAAWIDPQRPLQDARAVVQQLLAHDWPVMRSIGAFLVGVHALAQPEASEPMVLSLFEELPSGSRAWLLASLVMLVDNTPPRWLPMLEELTERFIADEPGAIGPPKLLPFFDALYVPVALAAAKAQDRQASRAYSAARAAPPLLQRTIERALDESATARDHMLFGRLAEALAIVGFYRPASVLSWWQPQLPALLANARLKSAVVSSLATVRSLHVEAVDRALLQAGADEACLRDVAVLADPARVQPFMRLVGFYNNAVHQCVHYPRMRIGLSDFAVRELATAHDAGDFAAAYASQALAMAREDGFDMRRWMQTDQAAPAASITTRAAA
jgi:hypothetical protein